MTRNTLTSNRYGHIVEYSSPDKHMRSSQNIENTHNLYDNNGVLESRNDLNAHDEQAKKDGESENEVPPPCHSHNTMNFSRRDEPSPLLMELLRADTEELLLTEIELDFLEQTSDTTQVTKNISETNASNFIEMNKKGYIEEHDIKKYNGKPTIKLTRELINSENPSVSFNRSTKSLSETPMSNLSKLSDKRHIWSEHQQIQITSLDFDQLKKHLDDLRITSAALEMQRILNKFTEDEITSILLQELPTRPCDEVKEDEMALKEFRGRFSGRTYCSIKEAELGNTTMFNSSNVTHLNTSCYDSNKEKKMCELHAIIESKTATIQMLELNVKSLMDEMKTMRLSKSLVENETDFQPMSSVIPGRRKSKLNFMSKCGSFQKWRGQDTRCRTYTNIFKQA